MNKYSDKIVITTGDANGIGAEIVIKALNNIRTNLERFVIVSNKKVIEANGVLSSNIELIDLPYDGEINEGKDTAAAGDFSFRQLETACKLKPYRIVTAPISKHAMHMADHKFNGQTEVLEYFLSTSDNDKAEMLFVNKDFRVLLLTRHLPLKNIQITKELLVSKVKRLQKFFTECTKIKHPRIALCALNPHAGEDGVLGEEEIQVLNPGARELQAIGIDISGAQSADVLLSRAVQYSINNIAQPYDCYVAMYHDQALIPVKAAGSDTTVNMTIGLDTIRTSPAHGTAFDIAGENTASAESMKSAILTALNL